MSQIARLGGVCPVEPKLPEDAVDETTKQRPAQTAPTDAACARSRAARAIVVDVLASGLWQLLLAETTSPPANRPRPLRVAPSVSQPAEFSGS